MAGKGLREADEESGHEEEGRPETAAPVVLPPPLLPLVVVVPMSPPHDQASDRMDLLPA